MGYSRDKLIDLKRFPGRVNERRYIAVYGIQPPGFDDVFCLTPHVMQWSEHVWLLDLYSCLNYWDQQSDRFGISLLQLYENILQGVFGEQVIAVCCDHPWQGLLFLHERVDSGHPGVYDLNSLFGQKAYRKLDWTSWFERLSELAGHLEAIRAKGFNAPRVRAKMAQMQRFVQRLDLSGPCALQQAEVSAITRRYSGWPGRAWAWTFDAEDRSDFPWRALKFKQAIRTRRHLDYPVSQWDTVEPLLKEDLNRLCRMDGWSRNDKITRLHWRVTLFNLETVEVVVRFRNPYSLHRDAPGFRVALYQAYYAYVDMMQALVRRDTDLDLPAEMPLVAWKLEITDRLHLPPVVLDLFQGDRAGIAVERLMDLQNCLPEAMEHYAIAPDFLPDRLFRRRLPGESRDYGFSLKQWGDIALARPLFYYPGPRLMDSEPDGHLHFLERTAYSWWTSENTDDLVRDYFMLKDARGRCLWVFRNSAGEWYQHGIYS